MADSLKAYLQRKKAKAEQSEHAKAAALQSRKEQQEAADRELAAQLTNAIAIANKLKAELGNDAMLDVEPERGHNAILSGLTLTLAANEKLVSYEIKTDGGRLYCSASLVTEKGDRGPIRPIFRGNDAIEQLDESTIQGLVERMIDALYDDGRMKIPE